MLQKITRIAVRNGTKSRPQAWCVLVDGETEWRDVNPLTGKFLMDISRGSRNCYRQYNRTPSNGSGSANWYVVYVNQDNELAQLLDVDPANLPIIVHPSGHALWARVDYETQERYAKKYFISEERLVWA
jgi:hypothetical protein